MTKEITKEDLDGLENAIHDAWSMLNLMIPATTDALMRTDLIDGHPNTPEAAYRIEDKELSTLWGTTEAMRLTRDMLWDQLQKI